MCGICSSRGEIEGGMLKGSYGGVLMGVQIHRSGACGVAFLFLCKADAGEGYEGPEWGYPFRAEGRGVPELAPLRR